MHLPVAIYNQGHVYVKLTDNGNYWNNYLI